MDDSQYSKNSANKIFPIEDENFKFLSELGKGSYGIVYKAIDKVTNQYTAVKLLSEYFRKAIKSEVIDKAKKEDVNFDELRAEAEILKELNHPNIVKLLRVQETESCIYIVTELINGGKLSKLIRSRKSKGKAFSMQECSCITRNLLKAVKYIHDKGIVHRDIKPENIMFEDENDLSSIKLIDFGLSAKYEVSLYSNNLFDRCGTMIFMAPEILLFKNYSKSVDVWSIGILLYMLISGGEHPFYKPGMDVDAYCKVLETSAELKFDDSKFSKISKDLIGKMLNFETIHRYNIDQALKHPWITRINETSIPITFNDVFKTLEIEDKLRQTFKLVYFCAIIKVKNFEEEKAPKNNYVKLLHKVTKVIDKWQEDKVQEDFINDEDYVGLQGSPNKFDTLSDFSEADNEYNENFKEKRLKSIDENLKDDFYNRSISDDSTSSGCKLKLIRPIKIKADKIDLDLNKEENISNQFKLK